KPVGITTGPDAMIWFTDLSGNKIWQVPIDVPTTPVTPPVAATPTPTPTPALASPTANAPTPTLGPCAGDCDGNGRVTIDEILDLVNIAFGAAPLTVCPLADTDGSATITVNEILAAVNAALMGCVQESMPASDQYVHAGDWESALLAFATPAARHRSSTAVAVPHLLC